MRSPFADIIMRYFRPDQWENADCITTHECFSGDCVAPEPPGGASYGPFQIYDRVWNPDLNPNSIFTRDQWAQVMDPNVNVWMASKIYERSGWSPWSTKYICGLDGVGPGPIMHPEGPVFSTSPEPPIHPAQQQNVPDYTLIFAAALMIAGGLTLMFKHKGGAA